MKIEVLTDMFLKFEQERGLFEKQIDNVYYWKYIRFLIMNDLYRYFDIFTASLSGRFRKEYEYSFFERMQIYFKKDTKFWEKRDVLIIPHERKYEWKNGIARCIYTDAIDRNLKRSHYILDSKCVEGYYKKQKSKNIIYADMETQFPNVQGRGTRCTKLTFEKDIIAPLEQFFHVNIAIEDKNRWINTINTYLSRRPIYYNYYKKVLDIICPKVIILTVGYSFNRMILCEVARERKIPVIELQHGEISKTHIAYNYFCPYQNLAFPNYIFCYGEIEKEYVRFPIDKENVIPVGFPELEQMSIDKENDKNKIKILFISQLDPIIAKYAKLLSEMLETEKYEIIFKLHPKEYDDWRQRYGDILQNTNIKIVGDFKKTIYEYLNKVEWVIGIYSTVLLEATMFDVNIVVLKEGLYEEMQVLYQKGYATLVDSPTMLASIIRNNKLQPEKKADNIFFKENSIENMLRDIERIIEENNR